MNTPAIEITVHQEDPDTKVLLQSILRQLEQIMTTQAELVQAMSDVAVQVSKIGAETRATLDHVAALENALNNQVNVSPEVMSAFTALKASVQAVDDLIPDAPVVPPPPPVDVPPAPAPADPAAGGTITPAP